MKGQNMRRVGREMRARGKFDEESKENKQKSEKDIYASLIFAQGWFVTLEIAPKAGSLSFLDLPKQLIIMHTY